MCAGDAGGNSGEDIQLTTTITHVDGPSEIYKYWKSGSGVDFTLWDYKTPLYYLLLQSSPPSCM